MKLRITVEGKTYEVDVEVVEDGPAAQLYGSTSVHGATVAGATAPKGTASSAPAPPADSADTAGSSDRAVKAPMAGVIVKLMVAPGDVVAVNQVLLTMEAMKMETDVASPLNGKVRAVRVSPGESVKAGQVLIELE